MPLVPAQLLEAQPLPMTNSAARHEVAALVAGLVLALDGDGPEIVGVETMKILRRGGSGARPGQRDRVAFALDVQRITIDLVEEQVAAPASSAGRPRCSRRSSPARRPGTPLARMVLPERANAPGDQFLCQDRRLLDQRVDPLLELRLAISTVGHTAIIGPGAWWIT